MKTIIYSSVSGDYDDKISDRIYIEPSDRFNTHRMNTRIIKVLSHKFIKDADYTIWLDSNLKLNIDPLYLLEYFDYPKIGIFSHTRNTINEEIKACSSLDTPERLNYHKDKPGKLACSFLIVRKNCEEVNKLNEAWWAEVCAGSSRDQLSFPYTLGTIATYKALPNNNYQKNSMWERLSHKKHIKNF